MKNKSLGLAAVGVLYFALAPGHAQSVSPSIAPPSPTINAANSQTSGDPVRGEATWNRVGCYTCHGYAAQGAASTGPKLSGRRYSETVFKIIVRSPPSAMPRFSEKVLSEAELQDILAFVNSIDVDGPVNANAPD